MARKKQKGRRWRRIFIGLGALIAAFYVWIAFTLIALKWIDPPFTAVHIQRRIASWFAKGKYQKRYDPVALERISPHLAHAVVASEDSRFYTHRGVDWEEVENALEEAERGGRKRGASTLTQQLARNLFLGTQRSMIRKGVEFTLIPLVEGILGKQRILELYVNVAEWGPGVFGAEAAARHHYRIGARQLSRDQAARLAAILPSPVRRRPARMNELSARIQVRMSQMGW